MDIVPGSFYYYHDNTLHRHRHELLRHVVLSWRKFDLYPYYVF